MKSIKKLGLFVIKFILGLLTAILILVIVINILLLLSKYVLKSSYPSIMDYTYLTIKEPDKVIGINKGDLLIFDSRKSLVPSDIVYYQEDNNKNELGKVTEINVSRVTIKNNQKTDNTTKGLVIGAVIVKIPQAGAIVDVVFAPLGLTVSIVILTIISIIQNLIAKKSKKANTKPDFNSMKRYN